MSSGSMSTLGTVTSDHAEGTCQVGTPVGYPQHVPKQRYTPPNAEVAAEIDAVAELFAQWQRYEAEYKARVTQLIDQEGAWKVPVAHMATRLGVVRKTIYRHAGRSMT